MTNDMLLRYACDLYGLRPPLNQTALCALMAQLLKDFAISSVWLSYTVTCEACAYWQREECRRRCTMTVRRACKFFIPSPDALVLVVQQGEVTQ